MARERVRVSRKREVVRTTTFGAQMTGNVSHNPYNSRYEPLDVRQKICVGGSTCISIRPCVEACGLIQSRERSERATPSTHEITPSTLTTS